MQSLQRVAVAASTFETVFRTVLSLVLNRNSKRFYFKLLIDRRASASVSFIGLYGAIYTSFTLYYITKVRQLFQ